MSCRPRSVCGTQTRLHRSHVYRIVTREKHRRKLAVVVYTVSKYPVACKYSKEADPKPTAEAVCNQQSRSSSKKRHIQGSSDLECVLGRIVVKPDTGVPHTIPHEATNPHPRFRFPTFPNGGGRNRGGVLRVSLGPAFPSAAATQS